MSSELLKTKRVLVLSPHLDDAALSVGGLILRLAGLGADVVVGTVFAADPPPLAATSPLIDRLHRAWGLGDAPIAGRRREDDAAVRALGARRLHGGLVDALYRTNPSGEFLYPTRQAAFSPTAPADRVPAEIEALLLAWLEDVRPDIVLCPLGVGRHVDHVLVSERFRSLAQRRRVEARLYEDMPYALGRFPPEFPDTIEAALSRTLWRAEAPERIEIDIEAKAGAIARYESQINELFPESSNPTRALKRLLSPAPHQAPFFETIRRASA